MKFSELHLNGNVLEALDAMRFEECTPIQEKSIPVILEGRDLIAVAQTGTGKTAAYLLPILNKLSEGGHPADAINCIVMAPTRELAQQIDQQMEGFSYSMPVSSVAVYGGNDGILFEQQKRGLTLGADVVIATPGRLIAHLSLGYVDLSRVSYFILDEADRMLDMGFYDDIMQIVKFLPKERQTIMFSATMPAKIQQLAGNILNNPAEVKLAVSKPAEKIVQAAYVCYENQKLGIIRSLFAEETPERVIIFASSKLKVKEVTKALKQMKLNVGEMHSDLEQAQREEVMYEFKAGRINILVATDIVARGIDIDDIRLVINYDVPHDSEDYVHRIGRTARANNDGVAITFVSEKEQGNFKNIEKFLDRDIYKIPVPEELGEAPEYKPRAFDGGRRGGRGNGRKPGGNKNFANTVFFMKEEFDFESIKNKAIEQLKAGKPLLGKDGAFAPLLESILNAALEGEMDAHLTEEERQMGNRRNGKMQKQVQTPLGEVTVSTPRDRNSSFDPQFIKKRETILAEGVADRIIGLYAMGNSTREISDWMEENLGNRVSADTISSITDRVLPEIKAWKSRMLDSVYPIVWMDAIHYKVTDERGCAVTRAIYNVLSIDREGHKELLGMYISRNEGANFWLSVLTDLQNRGVEDILIACIDGLKGFPEAIQSVYPNTAVQLCVVHQIRNSIKYVGSKNQKEFLRDLKCVYQAVNKESAENELLKLDEKWGEQYPVVIRSWQDNWDKLSEYFQYTPVIRKLIYTTNTVEGYHRQIRKVTKNKGVFPSDTALEKLVYLAYRNIRKKWTMPLANWATISQQLAIKFGNRFKLL